MVSSISSAPTQPAFAQFIDSIATVVNDGGDDEAKILREGAVALRRLIATDDWLPDEFAQPDPERYRQNLLFCDAREHFSVVAFIWGPGQATPIHNHTVWGLIGVLRGAEIAQSYTRDAEGNYVASTEQRLDVGAIDTVSPTLGDIHRVRNAFADRTSVSIHVYGGNIGTIQRSVFGSDGSEKPFVSSYSNTTLPNPWSNRS